MQILTDIAVALGYTVLVGVGVVTVVGVLWGPLCGISDAMKLDGKVRSLIGDVDFLQSERRSMRARLEAHEKRINECLLAKGKKRAS